MKGALICSTKCRGLQQLGILVFAVVLIRFLLGLEPAANLPDVDGLGEGLLLIGFWYQYGDILETIWIVLVIIAGVWSGKFYLMSRLSYCDIYEYGITGKAIWTFSNGMPTFNLNYNEIGNVVITRYKIVIYTKYDTFKIMALNNRKNAFEEIRNRISC